MQIRRTTGGTLATAINLVLAWVTGAVVLGNEWVAATPSPVWVGVGLLLLVWGGLILSALLRPVFVETDAAGMSVRGVLRVRRIPWAALRWVDIDSSPRAGVFAVEGAAGQTRFVAVTKTRWPDGAVAALRSEILARRPELPLQAPDAGEEVR